MDFESVIVDCYFALIDMARRQYYHDERAFDLASETVRKVLEARDRYDGRPLMAWCRVVMRNEYLNQVSRLSHRRTVRLGSYDAAGGPGADQRALTSDLLAAVETCRRKSVCVDALALNAEGYTYGEIADMTGKPVGTVKRRIHEARRMLREMCSR